MNIELPIIPASVPTHDNTMLNDYAYCPRWYAIRHHRGLVDKDAGTNATNYGSLLHTGLDKYYDALKEGKSLAHALHASLEAVKAEEFTDPIGDYRTKGRALHDMLLYAQTYGEETQWKILFTETAFEVSDKDGYRYGGKIDLCVQYNGRIWAVDHKTTSRLDKWYFDNYKLSPQMLGYTWGTQELRAGQQVEGVIINVIHVLKNETKFVRQPLRYSPHHIAHWRARNIFRYRQIAEILERDPNGEETFNVEVWNPNLENCIGKYGPCGAFKVCKSLPQNYERVLQMHFKEHRWDWRETINEDD